MTEQQEAILEQYIDILFLLLDDRLARNPALQHKARRAMDRLLARYIDQGAALGTFNAAVEHYEQETQA